MKEKENGTKYGANFMAGLGTHVAVSGIEPITDPKQLSSLTLLESINTNNFEKTIQNIDLSQSVQESIDALNANNEEEEGASLSENLNSLANISVVTAESLKLLIDNPVELTNLIISRITSEVTKNFTKIFSDYLLKHTKEISSFPKNVTEYAMEYFNENKPSLEDILKELAINSEEKTEQESKENKQKGIEKFIKSANEKINKFKEKSNKFLNKQLPKIEKVAQYANSNGIDWVVNEANKQTKDLLTNIQEDVNEQWVKDKSTYDEKVKLVGEPLGKELVKRYAALLKSQQKILNDKMSTKKKKLLNKLITAKAKAASNLAAKIGIYIPPLA